LYGIWYCRKTVETQNHWPFFSRLDVLRNSDSKTRSPWFGSSRSTDRQNQAQRSPRCSARSARSNGNRTLSRRHSAKSLSPVSAIQTLLGCTVAVFDWTGLGLHTGSRLGEYGLQPEQTGKGLPFRASSPRPTCKGQALAFILEDFVYYDAEGHLLSYDTLLAKPDRAATFHVTFSYDKSALETESEA
jgi:hypothetical protein